LYDKGFLFKSKFGNTFKYLPIPLGAVFIGGNFDRDFIRKIDEKYLKMLKSIEKNVRIVIETNGENLDGMIVFFVRRYMKEKCDIVFGGEVTYELLRKRIKRFDSIRYVGIKEYFTKRFTDQNLRLKRKELISGKRIIIIDGNIVLNFFKMYDDSYFGYISWDKEVIKERSEEFAFIWDF
jgi:nitrogenase molybdenum-iron protein alpha/beta subunit